ncbi:MAG TPA: KGG domain-containing protein [Ktedonobacteraceae bacterium]|jgi:hypothetical protein|nr:KGG domain-containing protein [Ktedonobacteraceae bacterium]
MSVDQPEDEQVERPKSNRGFASMSKEQRRIIASKGGKAAHALKRAHQWTHDEAVAAGKKGGGRTSVTYAKRAALRHGGFTDEEIQEKLDSLNKAIEE